MSQVNRYASIQKRTFESALMHHLETQWGLLGGRRILQLLVDDVLDYAAEEEELGKTIGKDLLEGNVTLPIIRTLNRCTEAERDRLAEIIRARSQDPEHLQVILDTLQHYDGLEYCRSMARGYVEKAKASLHSFADDHNKSALLTVASFVADRRN